MDLRVQRGQEWLEQLLNLAGFQATVQPQLEEVSRDLSAIDADSLWLNIDHSQLSSEQIDILIGAEGATIDAIQYLANSILNLNQSSDEQASYTIELYGYRARREAELRSQAESAAAHVRETGEEFELKSLSSAERRQIHSFFKDCEDLETLSRGQEPDRRLVVRLR